MTAWGRGAGSHVEIAEVRCLFPGDTLSSPLTSGVCYLRSRSCLARSTPAKLPPPFQNVSTGCPRLPFLTSKWLRVSSLPWGQLHLVLFWYQWEPQHSRPALCMSPSCFSSWLWPLPFEKLWVTMSFCVPRRGASFKKKNY